MHLTFPYINICIFQRQIESQAELAIENDIKLVQFTYIYLQVNTQMRARKRGHSQGKMCTDTRRE